MSEQSYNVPAHQLTVNVGRRLFTYTSLRDWKERTRPSGLYDVPIEVIFIDSKGRVVAREEHFRRAEEEGAYPIRGYAIEVERGECTNCAGLPTGPTDLCRCAVCERPIARPNKEPINGVPTLS